MAALTSQELAIHTYDVLERYDSIANIADELYAAQQTARAAVELDRVAVVDDDDDDEIVWYCRDCGDLLSPEVTREDGHGWPRTRTTRTSASTAPTIPTGPVSATIQAARSATPARTIDPAAGNRAAAARSPPQ